MSLACVFIDYIIHLLRDQQNTVNYIIQNLNFDYSSIHPDKLLAIIFIGIFSNLVLAFNTRKRILCKLLSKKTYQELKNEKRSDILTFLFSPDLFFSNANKNKINSFVQSEYKDSLDTYRDINDLTPTQLNHV